MKKVTIALLLTLVLALSTIGAANAVTDGELDGNRHPYVGLMVAQDADGNPQQEEHNGKPNESYRIRLMAESKLTNLRSAINDGFNIQTQGNGRDQGGTCNGDSGGPVFHGDATSNLIVAVTSFGLNELCRGADFSYRIDQQDVLDWLALHMYTP